MNSRYQNQGPIAEGGRGEVLRGWDTQLGREVAIKRVRAAATDEAPELLDDLVKEARTLSTLQHPNVVTVFDVGTDEGGAFIVMELVKGETLEDTVARGALTESDFENLVHQVLEGMIAAHAAGLIHLDIKPQNVMITWLPSGSFQVKILDFGLAMASAQPVVQETDSDGGILGSVFFMAPEQFERNPVDARTDLYSMGCVFYFALAARYPFRGETSPQVMTAHLYHKMTPLGKLRPDLPAFIPEWVEWLLSRLPQDRPKSTAAALSAFRSKTIPKPPPPEPVAVAVVVDEEENPADRLKVRRDLAPKGLLGEAGVVKAERSGGAAARPASARVEPRPKPPIFGKVSRFTVPILALLVVIAGAWYFVRKNQLARQVARFAELAQDEKPRASLADVRLLISYLGDLNTTSPAALTLARLQASPEIDRLILEAARNAKLRPERVNLLNVLSIREIDGGLALAKNWLDDGDSEIRKSAWNTVGSLAPPGDIPDLLAKLDNLSESVTNFAEQALIGIIRRAPDLEAAIAPVLQAYRSGFGSEQSRAILVHVLGRTGGKASFAELEKALANGSVEVRKAAINAFATWPTSAPVPVLAERFPAEQDAACRILIFRALGQLAPQTGVLAQEQILEAMTGLMDHVSERRETEELLTAISRVECEAAVDFFTALAESDPARKQQSENVARRISTRLEKLARIEGSAGTLPAIDAEFNRSTSLAQANNSLIYWESPSDWASWLVRLDKPGSYQLSLLQASESKDPGSFEILVAGATLTGQSKPTKGPDDYQQVEAGAVQIENPGTYRVVLRPVKIPQGESLFRLRQLDLKLE
jgi:tRNA A-37 threonylcarbamoyl transferase component Bud32